MKCRVVSQVLRGQVIAFAKKRSTKIGMFQSPFPFLRLRLQSHSICNLKLKLWIFIKRPSFHIL